MDLDKRLNHVNYGFFNSDYKPTKFALQFITFIKLVNGSLGEENKSPIIHYDMLDQLTKEWENLFVAFRGSAKTTALHEYMILYLAVYGEIPGFGRVDVGFYVSDTMENGVKSMRKNLEFRWENSDFLQKYIPKTWTSPDGKKTHHTSFTDIRWEFVNADGKRLCFRGYGATTGVRGFKEYGKRPTWCHALGTTVTTEEGTHLVEDHSSAFTKEDSGFDVSIAGLTEVERVTEDHQYWCKTEQKRRIKQYLSTGKTESTTEYETLSVGWVHAKDLGLSNKGGNQKFITHWLGEKINYTIQYPKWAHKHWSHPKWWWLYGLWMADGFRSGRHLSWCIAYTEESTVGKMLLDTLSELGYGHYRKEGKGCYTITVSDAHWSRLLAAYKRGNSIKDFPNWVMTMPLEFQQELLNGYIAGDGYETKTQTRINSVNPVVLRQLGKICGRLGIPYTIRNTKKAGIEVFPDGQVCKIKAQEELRFSTAPVDPHKQQVRIQDGWVWRKFLNKEFVAEDTFVPITTMSHTYETTFGLSHNCGMDDLMSDKNAESSTITRDIKNIVYRAARQALHPEKRMIIWTGTPFNKSDPLYEAASSPGWNTRVYPICEKFPCSKEEFSGGWEDRFSFNFVKKEYDKLLASGEISSFNQELMLRITSDEDRLVFEEDLVWYSRDKVLQNRSRYNFYITSDFATVEGKKTDFSVISVWAYTNNGEWLLIDGMCKRQLMDKNIEQLFRYVSIYKPLNVGIEINGQQAGFVQWIKEQMLSKNIFFTLAGKGRVEGIRRAKDKLSSFKLFVPTIKARKLWLPLEMKDHPLIIELLEELRYATEDEFKSKHDDVCDTLSMLLELRAFKPGGEATSEYVDSEDGKFAWVVEPDDNDLYRSNTVF